MRRHQFRRKKKNLQGLRRSKFIILFIAFVFFAVGCGGGPAPSSPPIKGKVPSAEKKKVEPVQVAEKVEKKEPEKKEEVYTYNPTGKRDPFMPFIQLATEKGPRSPHLTPLQKYDISQLKLVAIIIIPEGNIGLVEDSQGKGYFLKKGTVIGKNDGKVKKILKDRVIIEEVYQDIFGQTKVSETFLFLHRPEEGGES